ncbi:OmpA family protein [Dokdonia ponticola]|uniref:OmpA family protein n=1 Tax=Dokdonia ponticola TaxID=2041041 RepID=A0ABV9I111_9FLAO
MKRLFFISLVNLIILGCNDNNKKPSESEKVITTKDSVKANKTNSDIEKAKPFSWDDIEESTADIGAYPYIQPPKGMLVDNEYSTYYEFDKLEFFNGNSFFVLDGKVERLKIKMEDDKEWQEYYFQKSVSDYLKSIGAQQLFDSQIPTEFTQKWGADPNSIYEHMNEFYSGDVVNYPVSLFLLKTPNKKIGFQVSSTSRSIGIVEQKVFEQTIEKITANKMINDINTKGFTTLFINFDTGKSRIKAESYEVINEISKMLKSNPDLKISIEGHTDDAGNPEDNMRLSESRAQAVLLALTDEDVEASRLQGIGFGQTKPIETNTTKEGKAKNRRVELRKID